MVAESKCLKVIRADQDEDISFLGNLVIGQGILLRGKIIVSLGNFFIKSRAIVKGDIDVSVCVYVSKEAKIIGEVEFFLLKTEEK